MGRRVGMLHRLTQADLRRTAPGLYADGGNLYLQVTVNGENVNRSWIFRFAINGKRREMGLGAAHTVGLKDARAKAAELRKVVYEGRDPIAERDAQKAARATATAKRMTFDNSMDGCFLEPIAGTRLDRGAQCGNRFKISELAVSFDAVELAPLAAPGSCS